MSKTVIITGATGHLGIATVKTFLEEGHTVIAIGSKSEHLAFAKDNKRFELRDLDLSDETATAAAIKDIIAGRGKIDAALMLVGGFTAGNIGATTGTDIQKQISLNFETAYFVARPLLTHMQQNGYGRLVFIGSRPAISPAHGKDLIAYSLSKSLLFRLAEFINEENKGKNITASVVVPSTIDTPVNRQFMPDADFNNWVKPAHLADVLSFICDDKNNPVREAIYKVYNNS
jgi:NAD(P)-dependent dehydrogenase (short-subunit alcohol dehydrogenase family)